MKRTALVFGVLFLLLGVAGFAGLYAANPVHSAIYAGAGLLGIFAGLANRRQIAPPRVSAHDMRDVGGA